MAWRFDLPSFGIGFGVAAVAAAAAYRFRDQLGSLGQGATGQVGSARQFLASSSEGRYLRALVPFLSELHLAGDLFPLQQIFIEPQFIRVPPPLDPTEEAPAIQPFALIPQFHDMPISYSPYNIETLTINNLRTGDRHLAILGMPGMGKTTALALIALTAMQQIQLQSIDIMSDDLFEGEIAQLPPAERDKAIERRKQLQARALEQLKAQKEKSKASQTNVAIDFGALLPIYINVRDLDLSVEGYGASAIDPAEPIVKAMGGYFGPVTGSAIPGLFYKRLAAGTCLVLIDGLDELSGALREQKLAWLTGFMKVYGSNVIFVAGPEAGYQPLTNLGFTPLFIRAQTETDQKQLLERWQAVWTTLPKHKKDAAPADERTVRRILANNRGRTALDYTFKLWAALIGDEQEVGRRGWYDAFVRRRLDGGVPRAILDAVAGALVELGNEPLSRDALRAVVQEALSADSGNKADPDVVLGKLLSRNGLLVEWANKKYGFLHPLIAAYLAAESLTGADAELLGAKGELPAWELALPFAAAFLPMDKAVEARLNAPPDLLFSKLFSLANWLAEAPSDQKWRGEVFKKFTAALIAPQQFPLVRERAMTALVVSRDRNIIFIFRQGLRATDSLVRRLACIGLGAYGDPEATKDLIAMLEDQSAEVKLAAALALGSIASDTAIESMVTSLVYGEQGLRRAVAEALAALPGEGYGVLRDAIGASEMMLRHAAVFGLARIKTGWAVALLYRTLLEDEQWYVRNAAEEAFLAADDPTKTGISHLPEPDQIPWLVSWAATKGEAVPEGERARDVMLRALQEGDPGIQGAAAMSLATLGHVRALRPLYNALQDKEEYVRAVAFTALGVMQIRLGEPLPGVV